MKVEHDLVLPFECCIGYAHSGCRCGGMRCESHLYGYVLEQDSMFLSVLWCPQNGDRVHCRPQLPTRAEAFEECASALRGAASAQKSRVVWVD